MMSHKYLVIIHFHFQSFTGSDDESNVVDMMSSEGSYLCGRDELLLRRLLVKNVSIVFTPNANRIDQCKYPETLTSSVRK